VESQHAHVRIVDNEGKDLPPYQGGEIIELCKKNLASYKKPTSVEFVCRRFLIPSSPEKVVCK
jgi:hypothetical protein